MSQTVNCAVECINGCILGEDCPHKEYAQKASEFVQTVSIDKMHEIAEAARLKKMMAPPQWVIPDEI
ncbi:hypothetical protein AWQ21_01390 [Picosynechococcus sp. PCC 7003]|uniref:hypothetical protein n=1 Tax=Picosynechococcus sp. PCC 7003 TaxID=374981 RepID=UPI000810441F|nr:hypothetical protein [Picosynechococcus sp. PCC 7003]ANV83158.1 hypothetical protein AWQ21_01390 [Picosynechococcus sp. PCC 7003]